MVEGLLVFVVLYNFGVLFVIVWIWLIFSIGEEFLGIEVVCFWLEVRVSFLLVLDVGGVDDVWFGKLVGVVVDVVLEWDSILEVLITFFVCSFWIDVFFVCLWVIWWKDFIIL